MILLKVKNIKSLKYKLNKFISIFFYIFNTNLKKHLIYTYIYYKNFLIKSLERNLLISNNFFL